MMDDRNALFSEQTFARAVEFVWREAEMLDRRADSRGAITERRRRGELLGVQPDALGVRLGQGMGSG